MTPRISKQVAKVLDELWPVARRAHKLSGGTHGPRSNYWRKGFKELHASYKATWLAIAKWHLQQLAAKSKEGK